MKASTPLLWVGSLLFLTACTPTPEATITYEQNIKNNMKLSHVFVPPTNAYPPYTLLHYVQGEGFQQVCEATETTGLSAEEIKEKLVSKKLANSSIYKSHNASYGVHLAQKGVGYAGINYQSIKQVTITLEQGQVVSIPSVHMSDVNKTISTGKCAEDIKFFQYEQPNSKFFIPREVYKYTMKYAILDKNGANITAKLSKNLQKVVLANAGVNLANGESMYMDGEELYIGFKGTSIKQAGAIVPKGLQEKSFLDVTNLVKRIQKR